VRQRQSRCSPPKNGLDAPAFSEVFVGDHHFFTLAEAEVLESLLRKRAVFDNTHNFRGQEGEL
jgi:hypothetical protein